MARKNTDYTNIPKEKFEFFDRSEAIHDKPGRLFQGCHDAFLPQ